MGHHRHLTLEERERIMLFLSEGRSITSIAEETGRSKSTISREIRRNSMKRLGYIACRAQETYEKRRESCHRKRLADDPEVLRILRKKFAEHKWSPDQISGRLKLEKSGISISTTTIYRAIYGHRLDYEKPKDGAKGMVKLLRHKGKPRHRRGTEEKRGKIRISNPISARPPEAESRSRRGDWEADTVIGKQGKACAVTMVDRKSRFLVLAKSGRKTAEDVSAAMIGMMAGHEVLTITPDRGKEFASHEMIAESLDAQFYFPLPHHPWQRGTNENTNGLIREYMPKGKDMEDIPEEEFIRIQDELNHRPRKCLGYRTPYEVYYSKTLHLI